MLWILGIAGLVTVMIWLAAISGGIANLATRNSPAKTAYEDAVARGDYVQAEAARKNLERDRAGIAAVLVVVAFFLFVVWLTSKI